jgi:hypothetical protein
MTDQQGPPGPRGPKGDTGATGQTGDSALLVAAAERLVDRLVKADRRRRIQVYTLGVIAIVLAAVVGWSVDGYFQNQQLANTVRSGAVSQCISGNAHLKVDVDVWEQFIALLLKGNDSVQAHKEGAEFDKYVNAQFTLRNCDALYGIPSK